MKLFKKKKFRYFPIDYRLSNYTKGQILQEVEIKTDVILRRIKHSVGRAVINQSLNKNFPSYELFLEGLDISW